MCLWMGKEMQQIMSWIVFFCRRQYSVYLPKPQILRFFFLQIKLPLYPWSFFFFSHLAQNPFMCDCHLKWLADYLFDNPIETSGARCSHPRRLANKRISQVKGKKFRCTGRRWLYTDTDIRANHVPKMYTQNCFANLAMGWIPPDFIYM